MTHEDHQDLLLKSFPVQAAKLWFHAKCSTFINKDLWWEPPQPKKIVPHRPSVILSSIHFSSILSAKTCANVAGSDHFGPSLCLVQIQAASQVITETSLTEKHNTAHLSRKLWMFPGWFFFAKEKLKKKYCWHLNKFSSSTSNLEHSLSAYRN